ncbi:hypothetical protein [Clostridium saccharobutylicum]|uniref:Uncharacterized protein n=1 Tax=Clostridium saccharobutylicum DSM 13864 TaxID=1345695 RepID=U5MVA1_CLOSA|nr:hypothetical protein [Clostridium saccharobutylicum]AGX44515.1 hypothetical protein CLSA_c35540 [Clostridium saccharobutylicum DSM 13864]AQR91808.1 hypothetical protein CLOSC_35360 [Clostridium saccharobutylicum]AQS01710.1 hypothetical protein CSACC_35410 [Clostridium saccharobutylicum]AQS11316.1 hypothetical protein CLOBY_34720 [Clostridium saccharobutylicum]AQS15693.1 hypothetical protein CLOSACC_35410 [Clostridium saccharobutylicum]
MEINTLTPIGQLMLNLQEKEYPYFDDVDLNNLLITNENNVLKASWRGCLLKAVSDDIVKVGSIEVKSSNKDYWNNLAAIYKADYLKEQRKLNLANQSYNTSMKRADEI